MKRSFTNAKILILALMLTAAATTGASAQKTRDQLFPAFQKDVSAFQKTDATADPGRTATSTRSLIFTNYQPGRNSTGVSRRSLQRPVSPGAQPLPSDISAAEAARKITPPAKNVKPQLPQQQ